MESTSYVLSFRMVFSLPCDHGLDFLHQLMREFNQSIKNASKPSEQSKAGVGGNIDKTCSKDLNAFRFFFTHHQV